MYCIAYEMAAGRTSKSSSVPWWVYIIILIVAVMLVAGVTMVRYKGPGVNAMPGTAAPSLTTA